MTLVLEVMRQVPLFNCNVEIMSILTHAICYRGVPTSHCSNPCLKSCLVIDHGLYKIMNVSAYFDNIKIIKKPVI